MDAVVPINWTCRLEGHKSDWIPVIQFSYIIHEVLTSDYCSRELKRNSKVVYSDRRILQCTYQCKAREAGGTGKEWGFDQFSFPLSGSFDKFVLPRRKAVWSFSSPGKATLQGAWIRQKLINFSIFNNAWMLKSDWQILKGCCAWIFVTISHSRQPKLAFPERN